MYLISVFSLLLTTEKKAGKKCFFLHFWIYAIIYIIITTLRDWSSVSLVRSFIHVLIYSLSEVVVASLSDRDNFASYFAWFSIIGYWYSKWTDRLPRKHILMLCIKAKTSFLFIHEDMIERDCFLLSAIMADNLEKNFLDSRAIPPVSDMIIGVKLPCSTCNILSPYAFFFSFSLIS